MNKLIKYSLIVLTPAVLLAGCTPLTNKSTSSTPMPESIQTIEEHNPQLLQQNDPINNFPEPVNVECSDLN